MDLISHAEVNAPVGVEGSGDKRPDSPSTGPPGDEIKKRKTNGVDSVWPNNQYYLTPRAGLGVSIIQFSLSDSSAI